MTLTEGAIIFINVLILAYVIYAKEYLKGKGANLAKKEDIGNITREIERVKDEFTLKNNLLNVQLQHIINNQIEHSNEERNSIIKFYECYSKWINSGLLDIEVFKYRRNNVDELTEKKRSLDVLYYEARMTQDKIGLLVEDSTVNKLSLALVSETLKFNHVIIPKLLSLESNLQADKLNSDLFIAIIQTKPIPADAKILAEREKELQKERDVITQDILKAKSDEYSRLLPSIYGFTACVKDYLKKQKTIK